MHIESLKVFCDLIDTSSFSKAANLIRNRRSPTRSVPLEEKFNRRSDGRFFCFAVMVPATTSHESVYTCSNWSLNGMTHGCPSDEDLAVFAEANVSPEERLRIEGHLSRCSTCREIVEFVIKIREIKPEPLNRTFHS